MSDNSKIEWTDATWNPVTGCTKVSEGCRHCYAMTFAERFRGVPGHYFKNGFDITLRPDKLVQPMRWTKPRKIFVNSMSDLFHKDIPDDYIRQVFDVMAQTPQHTYQVLTKRPDRMRDFVNNYGLGNLAPYPLPNVWLGTSVENQKAADERIPDLIQTSAAKLFLSCEPLLGQLDLEWPEDSNPVSHCCYDPMCGCRGMPANPPLLHYIDWVIVGGESGRGARPMHEEWVRGIQKQCAGWNVPFFFKQWGGVNKASTGRELDGRTYDEMPA